MTTEQGDAIIAQLAVIKTQLDATGTLLAGVRSFVEVACWLLLIAIAMIVANGRRA